MAFFVNKTEEQSNSDKFLKDIDVSIAAGVSMLSYGQLNEAQKYYNYAQVCIDAYNDYMNDDVYALADLAEKSNPKQSFFPLFCHLASDLLITYLQLCIVNYEL